MKASRESIDDTLMRRIALVRLRRFTRVAAAAEESGSLIWRKLARQAAFSAFRDCLLVGLRDVALDIVVTPSGPSRAA